VAQPGQIVISEETERIVRGLFQLRPAGEYQPKGISRLVSCFEVLGPATAAP
jgi:class 3 adenylate cyclase